MSLFYDEVKYAREHSIAYVKRGQKIGVGRIGEYDVTLDEVVKELNSLGIKTSEDSIQRYAKDKLIPMPERKSAGRGQGKISNYADETPAEFYASYVLKHEHRLKSDKIADCRKKGLLMAENKGLTYINWIPGFGDAGVTPETYIEVEYGQIWLREKHRKLQHHNHSTCPICKNLQVE
jgi:hypothetical protein